MNFGVYVMHSPHVAKNPYLYLDIFRTFSSFIMGSGSYLNLGIRDLEVKNRALAHGILSFLPKMGCGKLS
jgi:hypothetical protein